MCAQYQPSFLGYVLWFGLGELTIYFLLVIMLKLYGGNVNELIGINVVFFDWATLWIWI